MLVVFVAAASREEAEVSVRAGEVKRGTCLDMRVAVM